MISRTIPVTILLVRIAGEVVFLEKGEPNQKLPTPWFVSHEPY